MDKLTKVSKDHSEISEYAAFFIKSSDVFSNSDSSDYIEKFQICIDEYLVAHFKFEDN